jgi:type IV secretion system protein VirD4
MDLTALPAVLSRDPPTPEEVTNLVDAFVAQLQWTDKVDDDISEKMSSVSEEGKAQRTAKHVDRSLMDREGEERDV